MKSKFILFFLFFQCIFTTVQVRPATAAKPCTAGEVFFPSQFDFFSTFTGCKNFNFRFVSILNRLGLCNIANDNTSAVSASAENIMTVPDTFILTQRKNRRAGNITNHQDFQPGINNFQYLAMITENSLLTCQIMII